MYSENILAAHNKWLNAESEVPKYNYVVGYNRLKRRADRLYKKYRELCKESSLNPYTVSCEIAASNPPKLTT